MFRHINKLKGAHALRRFATASNTRLTVLPNGMTVATEQIPHTLTATVGVWIDAGSRADVTDKTSGTAHFLEHLAFKGTKNRTQVQLEMEVEDCGSHLNAYTSRENTVYYAKTMKDDIPRAVDILSDILTRSKLEKMAIERERSVIIRESEEVDKMYDEVVFDRLHEVVYLNQPLGRTILGPIKAIKTIQQGDLQKYISTNYKGDRMVLVGAGCVDHDELVRLALENFGHVPISDKPTPLGQTKYVTELPVFHSGHVHVADSSLPHLHIAVSLEGCSWSHKDYFTALVAQAIVGNWDRVGSAANSGTPLSYAVSNNGSPLANSYMSFSTSYADTGLWGMYIVMDKTADVNKMLAAVAREWRRVADGGFTDAELESAKAQLRGSLLLSLDGTTAIAEDVGRQLVTTGQRLTPDELVQRVDKVDRAGVEKWIRDTLASGKIATAILGGEPARKDLDAVNTKFLEMVN